MDCMAQEKNEPEELNQNFTKEGVLSMMNMN